MPRWLKILLSALGLLVLLFATLPWWLGLVLRPVARSLGAEFDHYEPVGFSRFQLTDVRYTRPGVQVSARRVEAPTPLLWLGRRSSSFAADDWKVAVTHAPETATPSGSSVDNLPALYRIISTVAQGLRHWLPNAELGRGEITWPGQSLALAKANWSDSKLTIQKIRWREISGELTIDVPGTQEIRPAFRDAAGALNASFIWTEKDVKAAASLWSQPLAAQGHFSSKGWWPDDAEVTAENWKLPADRVKLEASYAEVSGSAHLSWRAEHFDLRAEGTATPKPDVAAPPFEAQAEAHGDRQSVTVSTLHLKSAFATASLSAPLQFVFAEGLPSGPAQLIVDADLSKQPWMEHLSGKLHGTAAVDSHSRVEFRAELKDVRRDDFSIQSVVAEGALAWPQLELARLDAKLDDTSHAELAGATNLATKELSAATLRATLAGASFAHWLPAKITWESADVSARLAGPWSAVAHSGTIKLKQAQLAPVKPVDLQATWSGHARNFENLTVEVNAGRSTLAAAGSIDATHAVLRELRYAPASGDAWQLTAPASLVWLPDWRVENLQLQSANGRLAANLSSERSNPALKVDAANIDSSLAADWVDLRGPDWSVQTLQANARLDDGVVVFDAQLAGRIVLQPSPANVVVHLRGDRDGVRLEQARLVEGDRTVAEATGIIPASWQPAKTAPWDVRNDAPFEFRAHVEPEASTWAALADLAGVTLDAPTADIRLNGTLSRLQGELKATARRLAVAGNRFKGPLPEISDLSLSARADRDAVTIESLAVKIDGQSVGASGHVPLGGDRWRELLHDPAGYAWRAGEGHVEIADMDLAPLARRVPRFMAAQGRLTLRADLREGSHLTGELKLRDAGTRPLPALGVLKEITAELALRDRTLQIVSWSARLGGEPVELKGTITLPPGQPVELALTLKGENLPLVRKAGLLLRADLDLRADTDKNKVTRVSGAVNLRDCIVLADFRALMSKGPRTAALQPPYFAVETAPFNQWPLAVDVRGLKAMRINTAVLRAVASPNFHLDGTLGEPRAIGEVTADEGKIFFPFATFTVQNSAVRLSEADPYHPQLRLNATSRYHDYQLRLEGSGPLEAPNLIFSSVPSLEASEVLLMVTSGAVPESDPAARTGSQRLTQLGTYLGQGLLQGTSGDRERLEITTGEAASRAGRETYEFTYHLDDRWSLVGEYDEYDEYNAGLKWRAYTKEGNAGKTK